MGTAEFMRVTIRLFARLREITTAGELDRQVPDDATARGAWDALATEFPGLAEYTTVISCAVNEEYAPFDRRLKDGDEVAFLPPVSGGGVSLPRRSAEREGGSCSQSWPKSNRSTSN
jgi:molybdopterin converting factor subunit 1